jgi:hypothetical protein
VVAGLKRGELAQLGLAGEPVENRRAEAFVSARWIADAQYRPGLS